MYNPVKSRLFAAWFTIITILTAVSVSPALAERNGLGNRQHIELNLSADQRDKLKKVLDKNRSRTTAARSDLRSSYSELFQQFHNYRMNNNRVQALVKKISSDRLTLLNLHLDSQIDIRGVLTSDQFNDLRNAIPGSEGRNGRRMQGEHSGVPENGDVEQLNLTKSQQTRIQKLFETSNNKMKTLGNKLHADGQALRKLYLSYNLDVRAAKAFIKDQSQIQTEMLKVIVARQVDMRKILTEDQFNKLVQTMHQPGKY